MKPERRDRALDDVPPSPRQPGLEVAPARGQEGDVIQGARACGGVRRTFAQIAGQACRRTGLDADEVDDPEVRLVFAQVEPQARKGEGRPEADAKAHDLDIEAARRLKVRSADRVVAQLGESHRAPPARSLVPERSLEYQLIFENQ